MFNNILSDNEYTEIIEAQTKENGYFDPPLVREIYMANNSSILQTIRESLEERTGKECNETLKWSIPNEEFADALFADLTKSKIYTADNREIIINLSGKSSAVNNNFQFNASTTFNGNNYTASNIVSLERVLDMNIQSIEHDVFIEDTETFKELKKYIIGDISNKILNDGHLLTTFELSGLGLKDDKKFSFETISKDENIITLDNCILTSSSKIMKEKLLNNTNISLSLLNGDKILVLTFSYESVDIQDKKLGATISFDGIKVSNIDYREPTKEEDLPYYPKSEFDFDIQKDVEEFVIHRKSFLVFSQSAPKQKKKFELL